ncbi:MAG TPA: glutaredoxin family protein [Candidatus Binatia bacterium]|nr:glutaredoxin family protein [Candidatus Binatia bacterium]
MKDVKVYSTPLCAPCERLKRHLREKGVAFTLIDVMMDEEAGAFLERRGIRTMPVLSVDGELVVGFDPARIDELLAGGVKEESPA